MSKDAKAEQAIPSYLTEEIVPAESAYNRYRIVLTTPTPIETVKRPSALWLKGQRKLQELNIVEVLCISGEQRWFYEMLITRIDPETQSIFHLPLREIDFTAAPEQFAELAEARVEDKGGELKWCVVAGLSILASGLETKAEAEQWIKTKRSQSRAKK